MLIAQVAIFFERPVDDAFQFCRHIGIQPHYRCGRRVKNGFEDDR
jgi:hypothetical protein